MASPDAIWAHAFNHQISDAARDVLISFYMLGQRADIDQIESAFLVLHHHAAQKYNRLTRSDDFRHALQELDGAFLTYQMGRASFINPSVRDFLGVVISGDLELVRDVIASAIRLRQVASLWELSQAKPDSPISRMFKADASILVQAIGRLQFGPALHWERRADGAQVGAHLDLSDEGRIDFLARVTNILESKEMLALAGKAADHLISSWARFAPDIGIVTEVLAQMPEEKWFFKNGGEAIYLKLVDNMMNELDCSSASDCMALIEFSRGALGWTAADDARLRNALVRYEHSGVSDDISSCSSLSELSDLRDALDRLYREFGVDVGYEIRRLDEKIGELEDQVTGFRTGGSGKMSSSCPSGPAMSDDEIREMFHTLRDKS